MLNYDFNPDIIAREMTKNWKGYYEHSYTKQHNSIYRIVESYTHNKVEAHLISSFYSIASLLFAKAKKKNKPHKHRTKRSITFFLFLGTFIYFFNIKKSRKLARFFYDYFWQDRIAHGYMTTLRDNAWSKAISVIFNLPYQKFTKHSILFSEASVILDNYEYHEVKDAPWDEVEEKLRESFRELKKVLS